MKRLPMRKIREALRLRADGFSGRQVAQSLSVSRATISEYFRRADLEGLCWPLPAGLSDAELERRLFPNCPGDVRRAVPQPDWAYVHAELRRKGVTLSLLWEEYRGVHPDGYGYSRYCELYTRWEGKLSPVMRQRHPAGERLFVDYAGPTVDVVCPKTGEVRTAQIFVATLGASNYTYVEASWTQSLPDWISSHVRAFEFFGGVPAQLVPDNLKAGVTKACFYDPAINRTYGDMARHYDTAIVPARPRKPKDKAKVEGAVLIAERWILARLRNQRFFGLDEVNAAIRHCWITSMARLVVILGPAVAICLSSWIGPRLNPYLLNRMFMPNGSSAARALITMSILAAITTRCHISCYARSYGRGSLHARLKYILKGNASPPMPEPPATASTRRTEITCPRITGSGKIGRQNASGNRPLGSGRMSRPLLM